MESKIIKQEFKQLDAFLKGIAHSGDFKLRVGIMGQKNARADMTSAVSLKADRKKLVTFKGKKYNASSGLSNADIGNIHEFGKPKTKYGPEIPKRSFLRMPILEKSEKILKEMKAVMAVKKYNIGNTYKVLLDLGKICERQILDAFESGGFGDWKKNAPLTIALKGSASPLIDTGQLRRSISSEVVKV